MARTTTTQLLKSQKSRQTAIWQQEDQIIDFEWSLSDKSAQALADYVNHYQNRINDPLADPTKYLSYQKSIISANKAFTSNEIQRANIDIIEGRQPEEYKITVLENLYIRAWENGDMDLAQSLRYQIDNQYVQWQNRQLLEMAAGRGGGSGGGGGATESATMAKEIDKFLVDLKAGNVPIIGAGTRADGTPLTVKDLLDAVATGGQASAQQVLGSFFPNQQAFLDNYGEGADWVDAVYGTLASNYELAKNSIMQIPDPLQKSLSLSNLNNQMEKDTVKVGKTNLSLAEMFDYVNYSFESGGQNVPFRIVEGTSGYEVKKNKRIGVFFQYDNAGNFVPFPTIVGSPDYSGFRNQFGEIEDEAALNGYNFGEKIYYKPNANGDLQVIPAGEIRKADGKIPENITYRAGTGIGSTIKGIFGGNKIQAETPESIARGAGLVKTSDNTYQFSQQAKQQLRDAGVREEDLGEITTDMIFLQEGKPAIVKYDKDGNPITLVATARSFKDVDGMKVPQTYGWNKLDVYDQPRLVKELTQPTTTEALRLSQITQQQLQSPVAGQLTVGGAGVALGGGAPTTSMILNMSRQAEQQRAAEIRFIEDQKQAEAMRIAQQAAYKPPTPIAVAPVQRSASQNVFQTAGPRLQQQQRINLQPAATNINNLRPNQPLKVSATQPYYPNLSVSTQPQFTGTLRVQ